MNFGLAVDVSAEIKNKTHFIQSLSNDLEDYFQNRTYGRGIKSYAIGIVCVSPKFDLFPVKEMRPKYVKGIKVISPDGIPFTLEDSFEYNIKIDYETFKNASEEEVKKILAKEILASLVVFEQMRKKIKDFDMNSFKADLEEYFKSQSLI